MIVVLYLDPYSNTSSMKVNEQLTFMEQFITISIKKYLFMIGGVATLWYVFYYLLFKRFKFCSDGDCPLWALATLHALGSLPVSLLRSLIEQLMESTENDDGIMEILKDTNLSSRDECARAAAVIRWTLQSAWRSKCDGHQLTRDLLVLGVPRSHAAAFAEAADAGRAKYEQEVRERPFMVNRVTDASVSEMPDGAVNAVKLTLHLDDVFVGEQSDQNIIIDKNQAKILLTELKKAYKKIEELEEK